MGVKCQIIIIITIFFFINVWIISSNRDLQYITLGKQPTLALHMRVFLRGLSAARLEARVSQITHTTYNQHGWELSHWEGGLLHHWPQWGVMEGCWVCLLETEGGENNFREVKWEYASWSLVNTQVQTWTGAGLVVKKLESNKVQKT